MTKWIKVPQEQWDVRLESTHKHITASSDALKALDEALAQANKARDLLYNVTMKAKLEDSAELVKALRKSAKEIALRIKKRQEEGNTE